jgi:hypothetical protein
MRTAINRSGSILEERRRRLDRGVGVLGSGVDHAPGRGGLSAG